MVSLRRRFLMTYRPIGAPVTGVSRDARAAAVVTSDNRTTLSSLAAIP
jgi:hypothetical protein